MPHPITLCTRYSRLGASSRLRFHALLPFLEEAGFAPRLDELLPDRYLEKLYAGSPAKGVAAAALFRRFGRMPHWERDLLIEYELFPRLPEMLEMTVLRRHRYVLNFDDNVWENYVSNPLLRTKFDTLCRGAAGIIAANDFLMQKISALNPRCCKIPTPVDLTAYIPSYSYRNDGNIPNDGKVTAVWIGTPVTFPFLQELAPVLRQENRWLRLLIIGGGSPVPGVECLVEPWSEATEKQLLATADFGIMPLPDTPFARGKSSYKLLQYFAASLPVIASPVGENRLVVTPGCGLTATSPQEWHQALKHLADPENRRRLAAGAARRAADFSLALHGPRAAAFLAGCLSRPA
ncbi:MAG: glycosyltransferase [Lentisphaeria bacterium]|nr:glycosyltransferase [Lentisphaeria bacterium]